MINLRKEIRAFTLIELLVVVAISHPQGTPAVQEKSPERNACFGEVHTHTSFSTDAFIWQNRTTPDDAYRYAKGEAIKAPGGYMIQLSKPLDFLAVTDHSEYMGVLPGMLDPKNPLSKHPLAKEILSDDPAERMRAGMKVLDSIMTPSSSATATWPRAMTRPRRRSPNSPVSPRTRNAPTPSPTRSRCRSITATARR
jgi:hypothetical protein